MMTINHVLSYDIFSALFVVMGYNLYFKQRFVVCIVKSLLNLSESNQRFNISANTKCNWHSINIISADETEKLTYTSFV